MIYFSFQVF